jgi:hypothetical protein
MAVVVRKSDKAIVASLTYWLAHRGSLLVANMRHLWFEI